MTGSEEEPQSTTVTFIFKAQFKKKKMSSMSLEQKDL